MVGAKRKRLLLLLPVWLSAVCYWQVECFTRTAIFRSIAVRQRIQGHTCNKLYSNHDIIKSIRRPCSSLYNNNNNKQEEEEDGKNPRLNGKYLDLLHVDVQQENQQQQQQQQQQNDQQQQQQQQRITIAERLSPQRAWQHHHQATLSMIKGTNSALSESRDKKQDNNTLSISRLFSHLLPPTNQQHVVVDETSTTTPNDEKNNSPLVSSTPEWKQLEQHVDEIKQVHLRDLLQDSQRCHSMVAEHDGVYLDYSRQRATLKTMELLVSLARRQDLEQKIRDMMGGEKINFTEERAVLHTALRAPRSEIGTVMVQNDNEEEEEDVIGQVYQVLDQIKTFTDGVRSGAIRGYTGKRLRNIISVGIGGSYLGPEFLHECLKTEPEGINSALGYSLRFLSNVDPVDVERACADLDPEETLIVIVSKTFTTAETMLNARTMRQWLWDFMGNDRDVVRKHVVACASISSIDKVAEFGIDTQRYFFKFWDWVGGRYSVCSAAGAVPISLLYGYDLFEKFLEGARSVDRHFATAPLERNIPVLLGLLGVWNMSFLGYNSRTTLPYAEALLKLPAHIQQLDMESNGKYMTKFNVEVDYPVGEIDFGEPGTNGQHSFFQLLHMGQIVPCDFIGFVQSQHDLCIDDEALSSHDELMTNFFAQPDALAMGKTSEELKQEGTPEQLIPHKTFKGNRPSSSLLLPKLTAYATGQILAIYEHRTAVQGFIWDINSFDQWGVELGKKLAKDIKQHLQEARRTNDDDHTVDTGRPATSRILNYYIQNSKHLKTKDGPGNGLTSVTRKTHREHHPPADNALGGIKGKLKSSTKHNVNNSK